MGPRHPVPTDAELQLLQILWASGPATVREIHDAGPRPATAYTTTLKLLQIMHEKGLVRRDESARSHVYRAAIRQEATERRLLRDFLDRTFAGSTSRLVMRALAEEEASPGELRRIQRLLDACGHGGES